MPRGAGAAPRPYRPLTAARGRTPNRATERLRPLWRGGAPNGISLLRTRGGDGGGCSTEFVCGRVLTTAPWPPANAARRPAADGPRADGSSYRPVRDVEGGRSDGH